MDDIFAVSEVRGIDREQLLRGPPNISDNLRLPTLEAKASNKFRVKVSDDQTHYTRLAAFDDTINWQGEVDKNHPRFLAKMDGHDFQACLRLAHSLHLWSQSVPGRTLNVVVDYATTEDTRAEVRDLIEPYKTSVAGPEDPAEDLPTAKRRRDETHVPGQGQHTSSHQQPAANNTAQGAAPSSQPNARPKPTEPYKDPNAEPQLCANCWTPGHTLKDCMVGDVHTGAISGCPVCNVPGPRPGWTHEQGHHFDDCQKWERSSEAEEEEAEARYGQSEPRFQFLVRGRAKKPAIRSINFYLEVFIYGGPAVQTCFAPAGDVFPWTDKFAMERSGFQHDQNFGIEDPYWAGKTVKEVILEYSKNPLSFSHLKFIPAAQAKAKARARVVIRYALEQAFKDTGCQLWVSTMVECAYQKYTKKTYFNRVKLPGEEDFGQLEPTGRHNHAEAENGTKIKQEVSDDVAMADSTAPGVEIVTRGHVRFLAATKEGGPMEYEANNSNEYAPSTIAPSAATMAYARSIARWYMAGDFGPDSMMYAAGVWGEVLGQLFRQSIKQKESEDGLRAQAQSRRGAV